MEGSIEKSFLISRHAKKVFKNRAVDFNSFGLVPSFLN